MTSVRARLGVLLACALAATLAPATVSAASATPTTAVVVTAPAATTLGLPTAVRVSAVSVPTVSRSGRVVVSRAILRNPVARGRIVIAVARLYRGVRYVAGGTTPRTGFDCSGYTRYVFARLGIRLPRVSRDQYRTSIHLSRHQAVPGDLVFFHSRSGRVYHAAIYAGNGYIWHSPYPGKRVQLERIWTSSIYFGRARV
jgi:cell wall-associated NlpC family hydrolase